MNIWIAIQKLDRLVFTTREISSLTGMSLSSASQGLARIEQKGIIKKMIRGVWAMISDRRFSPLMLIPFLNQPHTSYVSFITALHLYGMISQIPQIITLASTAHTRKITTPAGVFSIHQIDPNFFAGFDWYKNQNFLIACPEKAVVDSLYLASRKGRRYLFFPELYFPENFSQSRAKMWVAKIRDANLQKSVGEKLDNLFTTSKT